MAPRRLHLVFDCPQRKMEKQKNKSTSQLKTIINSQSKHSVFMSLELSGSFCLCLLLLGHIFSSTQKRIWILINMSIVRSKSCITKQGWNSQKEKRGLNPPPPTYNITIYIFVSCLNLRHCSVYCPPQQKDDISAHQTTPLLAVFI